MLLLLLLLYTFSFVVILSLYINIVIAVVVANVVCTHACLCTCLCIIGCVCILLLLLLNLGWKHTQLLMIINIIHTTNMHDNPILIVSVAVTVDLFYSMLSTVYVYVYTFCTVVVHQMLVKRRYVSNRHLCISR